MRKISIVDSHTEGEPTRVVFAGGPELEGATVQAQVECLRSKYDTFRSAVVNEPRGSDVLVGALLLPPKDPQCAAGVIFFNNVGYLGMCGHGTIGLVATLAWLGRIKPGKHLLETPVGTVSATLAESGEVSVANVVSWRAKKALTIDLPGLGKVTGDVAWGGNWFFLIEQHGQEIALSNVEKLTRFLLAHSAGGERGKVFPKIDHIELFGPPGSKEAQSRNFVLCPGKAYDRSPCGTGTSAKLACLAADGKLQEGAAWIQESILGTKFTGTFHWVDRVTGKVAPVISGRAFVNSEATLLLDDKDPFCWGIRV